MVYDQFITPQRRDSARVPCDTDSAIQSSLPGINSIRSRRSSVSSFAESEVSIFSDISAASSRTSASTQLSSGWESSTPYDSDDEHVSSLYEDYIGAEHRESLTSPTSDVLTSQSKHSTNNLPQNGFAHSNGDLNGLTRRNGSLQELKRADCPAPVRRHSQPIQSSTFQNDNVGIEPTFTTIPTTFEYKPQHTSQTSSHPRRTATDPNWAKPSLVTQHERRVGFVENLVGKPQLQQHNDKYVSHLIRPFGYLADAATQLVALIWPLSASDVCTGAQRSGTPVITLRFFIRETLRRSRTSYSTLQVAMYYLALLNFGGQISKCDRTPNQALHCGRRMFLASLILASKYLQDRNYFTKAWSRISNLSVSEINRNEMALLSALEYKLHIRPTDFHNWADGISKCTTAVQKKIECPWVEVLMALKMWPSNNTVVDVRASNQSWNTFNPFDAKQAQAANAANNKISTCSRLQTVPEHRLGLARIGQTVNPTRPFPLPVRSCPLTKGNMQWQGMPSHLNNRICGNNVDSIPNLPQGLSRVPLQTQDSRNINIQQLAEARLLSPPKTPDSRSLSRVTSLDRMSSASPMSGIHSCSRPPPTPKEPLLSLNTTPDSNDGSSNFGSYLLDQPTGRSPSDSESDCANPHRLPQITGARFSADTVTSQEAMDEDEAISPGCGRMSTQYANLELREKSSPTTAKGQDFQRSIAAAVRAELDTPNVRMGVVDDNERSRIDTDVQERTRSLLNSKNTKTSHTPALEDQTSTANKSSCCETKWRKGSKYETGQRRKRSAGSFSGEQMLSLRMKKVLRA